MTDRAMMPPDLPDDTARVTALRNRPPPSRPRAWLARLSEPHLLFPLMGVALYRAKEEGRNAFRFRSEREMADQR